MVNICEEKLNDLISQRINSYKEDINHFKEIGNRFVNGEINSAEFKATSGGMGVYAQRGGKEFMIRLRILSGVLDYPTMKLVNEFIDEYNLEFVHFTTRQTIQLHHLKFDEVINIMERSLKHELITRGGGGNYPRNVSLSPLSGVAKEEAFDVTPYAILVNKYFLSKMNSYRLPRKFKVAFSNNNEDTANASIADLGFIAVKKDEENYFKVYIGGSLGVEGAIAVPYDELVKADDIMYHLEAALNLFCEEGDFENKGKARMRFIVKRMGNEEFLQCYKKHLSKAKQDNNMDFILSEESDMQDISEQDRLQSELIHTKESFEELLKTNDILQQKQEGLFTVIIHPQGGLLRTEDYKKIINFLENISKAEVRLSMEESIYIRNLNHKQAKELMELTEGIRKTTRLGKSVSCIGVPICQIGIQESQMLLMNILTYFDEKRLSEDILPTLHISGCTNSCGRHQVNIIGFRGKKKKIDDKLEDAYSFYASGKTSEENTIVAKEYGDILADKIPGFLYDLALRLKEKHLEFDEFQKQYEKEFEGILSNYLV